MPVTPPETAASECLSTENDAREENPPVLQAERTAVTSRAASRPVSLILPRVRRSIPAIVVGLFSLVLVDLLQIVVPRIVRDAVDGLTLFTADAASLLASAGWIALIGLLVATFRFVWRHCLFGLARHVENDLRDQLFDHLQTLSARYFTTAKSGDLMAHATNDMLNIRMAVGMGIVIAVDFVVMVTATIAAMIAISPMLTLYTLLPMPILAVFSRYFSSRMHDAFTSVQAVFSDLTEMTREHFAGIRALKAYTGEKRAGERMEALSRKYIDANMSLVRMTGFFFPLTSLFANLSLALVLFLGGRQTITADITAGDFVAFISYLGLLTWPMMAIGWLINILQRGKASLERVHVILSERSDVPDAPNATPPPPFAHSLEFRDVTFRHLADGAPALDRVSLTIPKGATLGIAGPPGAGKTTLAQLVPRLFDPEAGHLILDGRDLRDLTLADLRRMVAFVPQEPFLFAGTIRENIVFGADDDPARLERVLADAALDKDLSVFPQGLDTVVGEKGVMLSGGQKQRVALARALMKDAPILVLDDPVSQVDAETAARIVETLRRLKGERTILVVSHRLAALRSADAIAVMDHGAVTEYGTHEELMALDGYWSRTFRLQEMEEALHVQ